MRNFVVIGILGAGLVGCAGSIGKRPREVFSLPATQDEQRIDEQSTGEPTRMQGEQKC